MKFISKILTLGIFMVLFIQSDCDDNDRIPVELFNNNNIYAVTQGPAGPPSPTQFVLSEAHVVTFIETYHYFNNNTLAGEIWLTDAENNQFGPWQATGREGQGGVVDAYWMAETNNVSLESGTYTIHVSNIATWSYNPESGNRGFAQVLGYSKNP